MSRFFADVITETRQALVLSSAAAAAVFVAATAFPEVRPFAPFLSPLMLVPMLSGTPLMRFTSLLTALSLGAVFLHTPFAGVAAAMLLAFVLGRQSLSEVNRQRLRTSRAFGALGRALPGWQAFRPVTPGAEAYSRVLRSPAGTLYFVGHADGREVPRAEGAAQLLWWGVTAENIREHSAGERTEVKQSGHVVWVTPPRGTRPYPATQAQGVTTVHVQAAAFAAQLAQWEAGRSGARTAPQAPEGTRTARAGTVPGGTRPNAPSGEAQRVQAYARSAIQAALPSGWSAAFAVRVPNGEVADVVLTAPGGQRFVLGVLHRRDRMNLHLAVGDRRPWQAQHDAVHGRARQLQARGVLWQPEAMPDAAPQQHGEVFNVRGDAGALFGLLGRLAGSAARGERQASGTGEGPGPAGRAAVPTPASAHEVLGVPRDASQEQIRSAYRTLIKKYHPDRVANLGEEFRVLAEERSKAINEAYGRLRR